MKRQIFSPDLLVILKKHVSLHHVVIKKKNMLLRKFTQRIEEFLEKEPRKILLVNGARQIGKSYI